MKMQAKCPVCGCVLTLALSDADKRKRCPRCGRLFKVPEVDALQAALKILETSTCNVFVDEQGNTYG